MTLLLSLLAAGLHAALLLIAAPLLTGLVEACRARWLGRRGPSPLQPARDLLKLLRKLPVMPDNASDLYQLWPFVTLAATLAAALLTPGFCFGVPAAGGGDVITFLGLLGLAPAVAVLAGLESGSAVAGAAAARLAVDGVFLAAALLPALFCLAVLGHGASLDDIGRGLRSAGPSAAAMLALAALLAAAWAERGHPPAAIAEEYSGRLLALFHYAAMLRLTLWLSLLGGFLLPYGSGEAADPLSWPGGILLWAVRLALLAAALAWLESVLAWPPPGLRRPVLGGAMLLGLLAAVLLFAGRRLGA